MCGSARDDGYMYAGWIELCFRFLEDLFMLPTVSLGGVDFGDNNTTNFAGNMYIVLGFVSTCVFTRREAGGIYTTAEVGAPRDAPPHPSMLALAT